MSVQLRAVSPLRKTFYDSPLPPVFEGFSALRGETAAFQLAFTEDDAAADYTKRVVKLKITSPLAAYVKASRIEDVPVRMPAYKTSYDDDYLRLTPGLYPDLLIPLEKPELTDDTLRYSTQLYIVPGETRSVYVEIELPDNAPAGEFTVTAELTERGGAVASTSLSVTVVGASLPPQKMTVTQWFYADCLADYYRVPVFSEEHWKIIGNYIKTAVANGINCILTPCFTPPLDTAVNGERPTVQLVDVTALPDGKYEFGFAKFDRWADMCFGLGVKYLEINHLFTQWGATHAPKIMATDENGEYRRVFGWETDAHGAEYESFLEQFLAAMRTRLDELGIREKCVWHVSDEPGASNLDDYIKSKERLQRHLGDAYIMDALSDVSFYTSGAVSHPIPANNHIEPFLAAGVPELWTYYCCGQNTGVSNRFIAMPLSRTRVIGEQFYKFRIAGFLQWGYNFWNNQYSINPINPYLCTDGEYFAPAGDAFSVYPAPDGTAYESLRIRAFYSALCDVRALELCEALIGREATLAEVERGLERPLRFNAYPRGEEYILSLRERVNALIAANI